MAGQGRGGAPEEYRTNNAARVVVGWVALGLGAAAVAVGIPVLLGGTDQPREGFGPTLLPGALLGLGLAALLLGGVRLWQALTRDEESFALREDGLVHRAAGESRRLRWADVDRVSDVRGRGPDWLGYGTHLRIRPRSGDDLLVTGYTADARRLADAIADGVREAGHGEVRPVNGRWWQAGSVLLVAAAVLGTALWAHLQRTPVPGFEADDPDACRYFSEGEREEMSLERGVRLPEAQDERIVDGCLFLTGIVSSTGAYPGEIAIHVWSVGAEELAAELGYEPRPDGAEGFAAQEVAGTSLASCAVLYDIAEGASVSARVRVENVGGSSCEEALPEAAPELMAKLP
ncbi:hypothetical protein FH609_013805 [Streptomyces sp. 3MP-14]|uniref:PH domain-containing protein n=1 Tax=Streptomyces mimosae TaxID=2586635 RepID=A0A5N6A7P0_9ACTN|nr:MULTISPECIES: hypothetical protein [Streptomyces]KAB8164272.1 hypothetical protein FH607_016695 [Streptomyces mimosae]KAB8176549.1 hypothetical protein FH609_013805 [Streptomyces sp. 3MP-14]